MAKIETPFEIKGEGFTSDGEITAIVFPTFPVVKPLSRDEIEISAEFVVIFTCYEKKEFSYIKLLQSIGEKQVETAGISVYIPYEGEELWSLSKRLNVYPENLVEANRELQFPLAGTERIVVFRRKTK